MFIWISSSHESLLEDAPGLSARRIPMQYKVFLGAPNHFRTRYIENHVPHNIADWAVCFCMFLLCPCFSVPAGPDCCGDGSLAMQGALAKRLFIPHASLVGNFNFCSGMRLE